MLANRFLEIMKTVFDTLTFPKTVGAASLILSILLLGTSGSVDAQPRSSCIGVLPSSLVTTIKNQYPEWTVVRHEMLNSHHRKLFAKDHKGKCPGIVKIDFYG